MDFTKTLMAFGAGGFLSLLSVVNPLSTLPMYLSLTQGMSSRERARIAGKACVYCFYILAVSLFVGGFTLQAFGISYGALRIAGGMVVVILGHSLMYSKTDDPGEDGPTKPPANPSFFPLAMPGITGPGTIAVVIGISTEARELHQWGDRIVAYGVTLLAMFAVCLIEWLLLRAAPRVSDKLGKGGIEVVTKMSGFILICVGVQFIASGIHTLIVNGGL